MTRPASAPPAPNLSRRDFLLAAGAATLAAAGCATNPVTGESQLMLVGRQDEIDQDKAQSPHQFSEDFGAIPEASVNAYVDRVGKDLASRSHRPDMPYSFRVVQASYINAYAFPGGSIACTRGILLGLDNEAELAALLGHEIGHVNARHTSSRTSKGILLQVASAGLTIAAGQKDERYAPIAGSVSILGSGLLLAKYSRDDERQADALGLDYMTRGGYNPDGMVGLMQVLTRLGGKQPGTLDRMFASHPMSQERLDTARREVAARYGSFVQAPVYRERFMDETAPLRRYKPVVEAIQKGDQAMGSSKPEAAKTFYGEALKAVPDDYEALVKMSRCLLAQKQAKEAQAYAEQARAAKPGEAQAQAALGLAALDQPDYYTAHQAFAAYRAALPGNAGMDFLDGFCLDNLGQRAAAAALYRRYLDSGASDRAAQFAQRRLATFQ